MNKFELVHPNANVRRMISLVNRLTYLKRRNATDRIQQVEQELYEHRLEMSEEEMELYSRRCITPVDSLLSEDIEELNAMRTRYERECGHPPINNYIPTGKYGSR